VVEPQKYDAAPAPSENFGAAPAPAPTLLNSWPKFLKEIKVNKRSNNLFSSYYVLRKL
jgi:hypothetical protein